MALRDRLLQQRDKLLYWCQTHGHDLAPDIYVSSALLFGLSAIVNENAAEIAKSVITMSGVAASFIGLSMSVGSLLKVDDIVYGNPNHLSNERLADFANELFIHDKEESISFIKKKIVDMNSTRLLNLLENKDMFEFPLILDELGCSDQIKQIDVAVHNNVIHADSVKSGLTM